MKNLIKLTAEINKVYVNLNTLRYHTCSIYIKPEFEKHWVQVNKSDVHTFISEQRAQIKNIEQIEAKTE